MTLRRDVAPARELMLVAWAAIVATLVEPASIAIAVAVLVAVSVWYALRWQTLLVAAGAVLLSAPVWTALGSAGRADAHAAIAETLLVIALVVLTVELRRSRS